MNKYSFDINTGYCFVEKNTVVDIWKAREMLLSKKKRLYTKATKTGTKVCLSGTYLKCPYCGREHVANSNTKLYRGIRGAEQLTSEGVLDWTDTQISFFSDNSNKTLTISEPVTKVPNFCCFKCKRESEYSNSTSHVEVYRKKKKVTVKSEVTDIDEIFSMGWLKHRTISVEFPMYETITFDCYKGRIYVELDDNKGNQVAHSDITGLPHLIEGSAVYNAIEKNKLVNRTVKKLFRNIWSKTLPFPGKEFTVENIFKMTMFVDYPKKFYGYIPYEIESINVEKSFRYIAKKLNNSANVVSLFENSDLPQVKSVKKIFFDKLGLFFYMKEAEMLWEVIGDYNLFCKLMQSVHVFNVLSSIHMRPSIMNFIKDYCSIKGATSIVKRALRSWDGVVAEAKEYVILSDELKKEVQHIWKNGQNSGRVARIVHSPLYSTPMHEPDERIKDCNINGYEFFWLRTSKDYATAAYELDNCLGTWSAEDSPVVCVKKDGKYVAAIEVRDGIVVQVQGYDNCSIKSDDELYNAYEKWMNSFSFEKHNFEYLFEFPDMDDEEMWPA